MADANITQNFAEIWMNRDMNIINCTVIGRCALPLSSDDLFMKHMNDKKLLIFSETKNFTWTLENQAFSLSLDIIHARLATFAPTIQTFKYNTMMDLKSRFCNLKTDCARVIVPSQWFDAMTSANDSVFLSESLSSRVFLFFAFGKKDVRIRKTRCVDC